MTRRALLLATLTGIVLSQIVVYIPPLTHYYAGILADGDMHNDWLTHLPAIIRIITHWTGHAVAWLAQ